MVEVVLEGVDGEPGGAVELVVVTGAAGEVVGALFTGAVVVGPELGTAGGGSVVGATVVEGAVVEGAVVAVGLSGDVHPAGGVDEPDWPGMRTVPAHPKSENSASLVMVAPSEK